MGPAPIPDPRLLWHDDLALHLGLAAAVLRPVQHGRDVDAREQRHHLARLQQQARLVCHRRVLVPLRRHLCHHLGPRLVDLPGRDFSLQDPRQGRLARHRFQLVLEHGARLRRPAPVVEYLVEAK